MFEIRGVLYVAVPHWRSTKKKTQKAIRIQNNGRSKEFISQYKKTMGFN